MRESVAYEEPTLILPAPEIGEPVDAKAALETEREKVRFLLKMVSQLKAQRDEALQRERDVRAAITSLMARMSEGHNGRV